MQNKVFTISVSVNKCHLYFHKEGQRQKKYIIERIEINLKIICNSFVFDIFLFQLSNTQSPRACIFSTTILQATTLSYMMLCNTLCLKVSMAVSTDASTNLWISNAWHEALNEVTKGQPMTDESWRFVSLFKSLEEVRDIKALRNETRRPLILKNTKVTHIIVRFNRKYINERNSF